MIQDLWYKNAVIYSLDLETFMDSNGDGVGDFEGLIRRLDYLDTLGVDVIWLAPFQPSPNRDNGYDINRRHAPHGSVPERGSCRIPHAMGLDPDQLRGSTACRR